MADVELRRRERQPIAEQVATPSTSSPSPMASDTHSAFSTNQFVVTLVIPPMTRNTLMNPPETARLTLIARSSDARSTPGRRFSIPRKYTR
jgi:hypothetical protein